MIGLDRLTIFVNAEDANIEVVPGILEIIGIATVKRDLLLGREDQSHVIVPFVAIKMVHAALIQSDNVGAQPSLFFALRFNRGNHRLPRAGRLLWGHPRFGRGVDPRRHLFNRHQDVEL